VKRATGAVARRYARALLDVAGPQKAAALRAELDGWAALLRDQPDLLAALRHPGLSGDRKAKLLEALVAKAGVSELMGRLLSLLLERDRTGILPEIAAAYTALWNAARGAVAAEVVSAAPLDGPQRDAVRHAAAAAAGGREVELSARVDPALMGGVLLKMEGRTYDGTVRGRLKALRDRLRAGASAAGD
jgi:F-type H+-transporting ATPase subunit delta